MKTLLTFTLAIGLFLSGFAEPTVELAALSKVSIYEQKAKITLLEGIGRVKVYVKDTKGKTLYCTSRKVSKSMVMPFNLTGLPAGNYVIRIQTKDSSIDYNVENEAKKAEVLGFKANVKALDNRFVKVSLYEMLDEDEVTVRIYDSRHRLIIREKITGGPFARKYEFKNISTRGLYFSISDKKGNSQVYHV